MTARRRLAALLEVIGVCLAGPLVAALLIRILGLQVVNPLERFTAGITNAELITATRQIFILLALQYAGYFLLVIPINWWHRRRGPASYGLTKADRSWTTLLLAGLATAALATWPALSVNLANATRRFGETVPWRQAFFDTSWRRWEFWLFSGVLSWAFVAFIEELFYRGYCQRRLAEDWGDGPAIIGTACLFTFAHGQYWIPSAYNVGMVASIGVLAIGFGVAFAWTRSLVPTVIAHAVVNLPLTPLWQGVVLTALLIGVAVVARRAVAVIKQVFSGARVATCVTLASAGAGYAIASQRFDTPAIAVVATLVLAVSLEALDRRANRHTEKAPPSP